MNIGLRIPYKKIILIFIVIISLLMHYPHFSKDLMGVHVWRQTQTQSTINNFYEDNMNILQPTRNERENGDGIFRMEFPLMQWLVAATFKIFGNHIIVTRIFMFIIGLLTVLGIYKLLESLFQNTTIAILGAWAFNFSPGFYYYTINPIPDNFALFCSIWGIALFFMWYRNSKTYLLLLSGFLLSLGALCKLPFVLYYIVPFTYFILIVKEKGLNSETFFRFSGAFAFILLPFAWYIQVVPQWGGNGIVNGIFDNRISFVLFLDYLQHNLISALPELLLNYGSVLFFISGFYFLYKRVAYKNRLFPLMIAWSLAILGYFLFEINMIAKIHDYYLFPFYPLLFILVGYGAYHLLNQKNKYIRYLSVLLLLILPVTAYLRMYNRWNPATPGFNSDLLSYKNELRKAVPDSALCVVGNDNTHFVFYYYIHKKGWGFDNDNLSSQQLGEMIGNGAAYLYSDSRRVDTSNAFSAYFDTLMLEKGSIRVYKLKKADNPQN